MYVDVCWCMLMLFVRICSGISLEISAPLLCITKRMWEWILKLKHQNIARKELKSCKSETIPEVLGALSQTLDFIFLFLTLWWSLMVSKREAVIFFQRGRMFSAIQLSSDLRAPHIPRQGSCKVVIRVAWHWISGMPGNTQLVYVLLPACFQIVLTTLNRYEWTSLSSSTCIDVLSSGHPSVRGMLDREREDKQKQPCAACCSTQRETTHCRSVWVLHQNKVIEAKPRTKTWQRFEEPMWREHEEIQQT